VSSEHEQSHVVNDKTANRQSILFMTSSIIGLFRLPSGPLSEPAKQILKTVKMKFGRARKTGGLAGPVIAPTSHLQKNLFNTGILITAGWRSCFHGRNIEFRMTGE